MLFNSASFLWLFLPVVLLGHTPLLRFSTRAANSFLLVASLLFYIWGSGHLVALLLVSVAIDFVSAGFAHRRRISGDRRGAQAAVALSVVANVGLLGWFKYAGFLGEILADVARLFGDESWGVPQVALPIGISFFTFQSMSYTFDVARGRLDPFTNPMRLLLYVSLFPQLIAGPIVRAVDVEESLGNRRVDLDALGDGFARFVWGLAKKVLIADSVAPLADAAFGASPTTAAAWIGAASYAVQIYFDFSGYSDMAIGLGRMLGFRFPENFDRPYHASTVTDFWRRWHITLSSWFRDYLYIPLGGNRGGARKTMRNLIIVFGVTGLWHGAAWTFVLWGLWHGAALLVERGLGITAADRSVGLRIWTTLVVLGGWILFRSPDLGIAGAMLRAAVVPTSGLPTEVLDALTPLTVTALLVGLVTSSASTQYRPRRLLVESGVGPGAARAALFAVALPLVLTRIVGDTFSPFLYFQF